jgi:hypothetical protein
MQQSREETSQDPYGDDIYTEPDGELDTLTMLGPLRSMAGTWEGTRGTDVHPVVQGEESDEYFERYVLEPIDRQTNGPQLFYGLRYHTHIVKLGEVETFHDQVGYWLWEPADKLVTLSLSIPRGQTLLASGHVDADAKQFELTATLGSLTYGILSNTFLDRAFRTTHYRIAVNIEDENFWSYEQETLLELPGRTTPFSHTDRNRLQRIASPVPNPMSAAGLQDPTVPQ